MRERKWAITCLSLTGANVEAAPSMLASATAKQPNNQSMPSAEEGWALKKVRHAVTCENARNYLQEVFLQGEEAGHKANPADVATCMRELQNDSGKRRFEKKEWLNTAQISRYFSKLSTLNKSGRLLHNTAAAPPPADKDEDDISTIEASTIRMRQQMRRELEL